MYNLDINDELTDNELYIGVTSLSGIRDTLTLRIFFHDHKAHRFEAKVEDGPQHKIETIVKVPPKIMEEIIKGSS